MNKLVKGSIAGAAGIALLLGGAGTFALWNDSAAVTNATVSTGELSITAAAAQTWADISTKGSPATASTLNGGTFDPAAHKLVPGDTITATQSVTINASGKNLLAKLTYVAGTVVIPAPLATDVTVTVNQPTGLAAGWSAVSDGAGGYTITPPQSAPITATTTFNVVLTIKYLDQPNATQLKTGQNLTAVNFTGAKFSLVQVRP
jgi:alternate signal-mediated exported protein